MNTHAEKYVQWRLENMWLFYLIRARAAEATAKGRPFGVKKLVEEVRWDQGLLFPRGDNAFKLDNNLTAYIARDLIEEFPTMSLLVKTRKVRGEQK